MALTKQEITQGIVDTIIATVKQESNIIIDQYNRDTNQEVESYRQLKEIEYEQLLAVYEGKSLQKKLHLNSSMSFEVNRKLRLHRLVLFDELKHELYRRLIDYSKSSAYYLWINQEISDYHTGTLYLREEDIAFIKTSMEIVIKPFELGGFLIESDNYVLDFTLLSRFEKAMKHFTKTPSLEIRGD